MSARRTSLERTTRAAAAAARDLAGTPGERRAAALHEMADALVRRTDEILRDNHDDMVHAKRDRLDDRALGLLLLDDDRLRDLAQRIRRIADLPDPLGTGEAWTLPSGVRVRQERVPVGVVGVVYEPAVHLTTDAAAMCVRSGNVAVLRGGPAAHRTNRILGEVLEGALVEAGVPRQAICMIGPDPQELHRLVAMDDVLDLLVIRGEADEVADLAAMATVPVVCIPRGVAHVYVDASAAPEIAGRIVASLATPRPREFMTEEAVVLHRSVAAGFGAETLAALAGAGVTVTLVESLEEAASEVGRDGSRQVAGIVTGTLDAASRFSRAVDCACVVVNASPRYIDGGELGLGASLGVAVDPGVVRGPLGMAQLTVSRMVAAGSGQVP